MEDVSKQTKQRILDYLKKARTNGKFTSPADLAEILELESVLGYTQLQSSDTAPRSLNQATPTLISDLKQKIPKENPFIVDSLIVENAVTVIHADTGAGKSLFTLKLVDDVTSGRPFLNQFKVKKTKCLILDLEMTYDDCIVRTRNVCTDDNDSYLIAEAPFKITNPSDLAWLTSFIQRHNIGLVVFDTLSKIHLADENSNTHMTPVMSTLTSLAATNNVAIILLHHVNKSKDNTGLSRGRGASAIADNTASYLAISSNKTISSFGTPLIVMTVSQEKSRRVSNTSSFELSVVYNPNDDRTTFTYTGEVSKQDEKILLARQETLKFVQNNPGAPRKELMRTLNRLCTRQQALNAIEVLLDEGLIVEKKLLRAKVLYMRGSDPAGSQDQDQDLSQDELDLEEAFNSK